MTELYIEYEDIVKWGKKVWMRNGAFYYEVKDE